MTRTARQVGDWELAGQLAHRPTARTLLEGGYITDLRTGAGTALAEAEAAAREDAERVTGEFPAVAASIVEGASITEIKPESAATLKEIGTMLKEHPELKLTIEGLRIRDEMVFSSCQRRGLPVAVFPVHEYWSDIGTADDLDKARALFS